MNFFSFVYVQVIGLGTASVGGHTKKTTYSAGIFIGYCVGNLIGPLLFDDDDAPRYNPGFMGVMICLAAFFVIAQLLRVYLVREN
ncbi:hypothetical protein BJX63DRAFT_436568 [Aspergillus granulosus]|uniref:Uncharacterized protein n=1 Tax=Aspergillus granulosus TaxID=176169 RepID=A0ABR4GXY5_9EURO